MMHESHFWGFWESLFLNFSIFDEDIKIGKTDKLGFFQFFDKRVGVVSWYGQNTNIFAHLLHLDNVRLLYFLQNHIFRLKSSEKYWKSNCLLQVNFENRNRVNWHQLMFYIKWWVFVIIKMPCFHIYNIFKCHFKPNQKCQRDMKHPVKRGNQCSQNLILGALLCRA